MMHPRKFKIDENLPVDVAVILRRDGHDALTIGEQAMSGQPDTSVADVCRREGRVLVTLDLDFADIRAYPPGDYFGLVVLRPATQDKPRVLHLLGRVLQQLGADPMERTVWIVDEGGIRVREGT